MSPHRLRVLLWAFAGIVLGVGVLLAKLAAEPHLLSRAGALVAALSAASGYIQIRLDLAAAKKERLNAVARGNGLMPTPLEALGGKLDARARAGLVAQLEGERLHIAATVVAVAAIGEFFHGFGDLLLAAIWP